MKSIIARILLISDPHYSVNSKKEEEKWFPPLCDFLEKRERNAAVKKFLNYWDTVTQKAFVKTIETARRSEPYDLLIGLGDYTPGSNESGMLTTESQQQYAMFKEVLDVITCPKKLVWGDHDVGYLFNVENKIGVKIGTEKGGISAESAEVARQLIGPPFDCFYVKNAKFILISTNLLRNVDGESPVKLQKLKREQESFLTKSLREDNGDKMIFILLHDPTTLGKEAGLRKILDVYREKITAIIHGHLHAEISRLLATFSPVYAGLRREYKTVLVPASWGMMGIGGGFSILSLHDDGTYKVEKYKV